MPQQAKSATTPRKIIEIKPISSDGKIQPRSIDGFFARWRWVFVWLTQIVFYGLCWLPWNGRQAVLFDIDEGKFYIFKLVLWPQDTIYLVALMVLGALALFLFTAVAGRVWCGYSCPQTVYTSIFMWIERKIEGERTQRMKLDAAPWSPGKIATRGAKHLAWGLFSLWTGITFVGYFTPIAPLIHDIGSLSLGLWSMFWIALYALLTYGNAGFLREQMCKQICPYARFQFVMFDPDTLIIAYDTQRGEPRGSRPKSADPAEKGLGSCVDCGICVQVCPTGIDIRNGLQNECIGCAACIDACDQVMDKMDYPRGLIRYSTENAVVQKLSRGEVLRRTFRPRVLIYTGIFVVLTTAVGTALTLRVPLKVDVLRDTAVMSQEAGDGAIENIYRLQIMNTSEQARSYVIEVDGIPGIHVTDPKPVSVAGGALVSVITPVRIDAGAAAPGSTPIAFHIRDAKDPAVAVREKSKFWVPRD